MQRLAVVGLFLMVMFSGCAKGTSQSADPTATNVIQVSGEVASDSGSIEGVVVDETVAPIAGAVVTLEGLEGQAVTDEQGMFGFTNLPAGAYTLFAARLGFESAGKKVDVVPGEVTAITVTLGAIRIAEAYAESIEYRLMMACGGGLVVVTFTGGCPSQVLGMHDVTADHNVTGDPVELRTTLSELTWLANSGFSSKELRLAVGIDESGGNLPTFGKTYGDETGLSPVMVREDASEGKALAGLEDLAPEDNYIRSRIWVPFSSEDPPVVVLVLQQQMTVWSTFGYGDHLPEAFSALPDA